MKSLFSFLVLLLAAVVQAVSSTGSRLLVILDNVADKDRYSTFLGDLAGMWSLPFAYVVHPVRGRHRLGSSVAD